VQVQHRLIIRHPRQRALLLVNDQEEARLPAFTSDDRHTAEVDYINAAVQARFGLQTTVLQSVRHSTPQGDVVVRMHELETHGDSALRSNVLRWHGPADLLPLSDREEQAAVAEWLTDDTASGTVVDGREWTRPGWFAAVRGWLARTLHDAGLGTVRDIIQVRAWQSSCVLRVHATGGDYYFKAVPESLRRECTVTGYLARHFPDAVPCVIAADLERRWLLMAACDGRQLEEVTDATLWEHAAARYARLQVACVPHVQALQTLGCARRGLDTLAQAIGPLSRDLVALCPGTPDGLAVAEVERLQALVPTLQRQCEQLDDCGIPYTLEHGDLWPGNFLIDHHTCTIIDWEDAAIAHPFFSLAPLSVGLSHSSMSSAALLDRLVRAYLTAFAELMPAERLYTALHLAVPLGLLDMAVRYRHQPPSMVQLHPWMRDLVPHMLRLALARLV
jgi:hypothetical protein